MRKTTVLIFIIGFSLNVLLETAFLSAAPQQQMVQNASLEFRFTFDVFQAIHEYSWGVENYDVSGENLTMLMAGIIEQNSHLEKGQSILKGYLNNQDVLYYPVALGISRSFELIIEKNNVILNITKNISNNEQDASKDLDYKMAELIAAKKQAGQLIVASIGGLIPILVEPAKSDNPKGPVLFKISKKEREMLLARINELFGDELKKYDEYNKMRVENKEGDPEALTWTTVGISHIRNSLLCENYEDWKRFENP